MAEGKCDCCGSGRTLYPVGMPIAAEPEKFTKFYFMCKDCINKITEGINLVQAQEATRDLKAAYEEWSEKND